MNTLPQRAWTTASGVSERTPQEPHSAAIQGNAHTYGLCAPEVRELALNPAAAISGASKVAFVTAEAISHGATASSRGHRSATATAAAVVAHHTPQQEHGQNQPAQPQ